MATPDGRLRIEFVWQHDRFVHKLLLDDVQAGISLEGDADGPWPPSPPLQQLSREEINGCDVILGVGAAGRSHWSVSVELDPLAEFGSITFDLACRCNDRPEFLGSSYRLAESILFQPLSPPVASDRVDEQGIHLLEIRAPAQQAGTFRWSYRLDVAHRNG